MKSTWGWQSQKLGEICGSLSVLSPARLWSSCHKRQVIWEKKGQTVAFFPILWGINIFAPNSVRFAIDPLPPPPLVLLSGLLLLRVWGENAFFVFSSRTFSSFPPLYYMKVTSRCTKTSLQMRWGLCTAMICTRSFQLSGLFVLLQYRRRCHVFRMASCQRSQLRVDSSCYVFLWIICVHELIQLRKMQHLALFW